MKLIWQQYTGNCRHTPRVIMQVRRDERLIPLDRHRHCQEVFHIVGFGTDGQIACMWRGQNNLPSDTRPRFRSAYSCGQIRSQASAWSSFQIRIKSTPVTRTQTTDCEINRLSLQTGIHISSVNYKPILSGPAGRSKKHFLYFSKDEFQFMLAKSG